MTPGIYDYFQRACRRISPVEGVAGETIVDGEGNTAVFWVTLKDSVIQRAVYRCTTCVTLVAFCEHLVELVQGHPLGLAFELSAAELLEMHTDVPAERRQRAALAVSALHSAVQKSTEETTIEGRIHIFDTGTHGFI